MLVVFDDFRGVYREPVSQEITVNADYYCNVLRCCSGQNLAQTSLVIELSNMTTRLLRASWKRVSLSPTTTQSLLPTPLLPGCGFLQRLSVPEK